MRSRTGPDGSLNIHVPTDVRDAEVDVVVVVRPVDRPAEGSDAEALGWPPGFFERTFGSLAGSGLKRHPQGDYEIRDTIP